MKINKTKINSIIIYTTECRLEYIVGKFWNNLEKIKEIILTDDDKSVMIITNKKIIKHVNMSYTAFIENEK